MKNDKKECKHQDKICITAYGDNEAHYICRDCGTEITEEFTTHPDGYQE